MAHTLGGKIHAGGEHHSFKNRADIAGSGDFKYTYLQWKSERQHSYRL
ncbi:MAG: hypothetical protein J6K96_01150 [Treponema sp.]|nr:hypothetical protein [Treponema sp.]